MIFFSQGSKSVNVFFSTEEVASSVKGAHAVWENGKVLDLGARITTESRIRLLRAGCARSVRLDFFYPQFQEATLKPFFGWCWWSFGPFCLPRLCSDGEDVHLYHTTDNSRVYHKEELKSLEIPAQVNERSRNCTNCVTDAAAFDVTVFFWEFGCCRVPDPCLSQICDCGKFAMWFCWWQGLSRFSCLIVNIYSFFPICQCLCLSCFLLPPSHRLVWPSCFLRKGLFTLQNLCNGTSNCPTASLFCTGWTVTVNVLICFLLSIEIKHILSSKMKHLIK